MSSEKYEHFSVIAFNTAFPHPLNPGRAEQGKYSQTCESSGLPETEVGGRDAATDVQVPAAALSHLFFQWYFLSAKESMNNNLVSYLGLRIMKETALESPSQALMCNDTLHPSSFQRKLKRK